MKRKHAFNLWRDKGNKWRGGHTRRLHHWEIRDDLRQEECDARYDILSRLEGNKTLPAYSLGMISEDSEPTSDYCVFTPAKKAYYQPHAPSLPWEN